MKSVINSLELSLYFVVWIWANIYSLYKLFVSQSDILENNQHLKRTLRDLDPGWSFIARDKDVSDVEWSTWKFYIQTAWLYMIIQFITSELLRKTWPSLLKYWFILSTIIFVSFYLGLSQILVIVSQPLIYSIVILLGGKQITIWVTSIILLVSYNSLKSQYNFWQFLDHGNLQDEEVYLLLFGVAWIELRCISFSLDFVEKKEKNIPLPSILETLVNMFSYVLYLPLLYVGPMMLYEDFEKSFHTSNQNKLKPRLKRFAVDMILFHIYMFLMELAFHYMYFYAMKENIEIIRKLPPLALCGGGLWMAFQFHLKYVITYGTSAAFARLDNMDPPPTPRCIARIHIYSLMWRYFDVGLYKFLVKYIYRPSYGTLLQYVAMPKITYKLIASFVTFAFIFMWHGTVSHILIWSILNYFGILMEYSAKAVSTTDGYKKFKERILKTEAMEVRFVALLSSPLLALSAISNFYLFGGKQVGDLFIGLLKAPAPYNLMIVMMSVYCCCHVSISIIDVPSRTDVTKRKLNDDLKVKAD